MKKKVYIILFALIQSYSYSFGQSILSLQPDSIEGKDARIDSWTPNTNRGKGGDLMIKYWTIDGESVDTRILIEFNITSIPANSTINNAKLSLYYWPLNVHSSASGSNKCWIQRVIQPWSEDLITWNNQPSTTTNNQVELPETISPTQDFLDIDVSHLVQDMVNNPSSSHGIMIKLQTEEAYRAVYIASSNFSDASKHPKLVINYNSPVLTNEKAESAPLLEIYPNPASNLLNIKQYNLSNATIQLYNIKGELLYSEIAKEDHLRIDLSGINQGFYILKITKGNSTQSEKVVIVK